MKTKYRFIHFVMIYSTDKTQVWDCRNNRNGGSLGTVRRYYPWDQDCFVPEGNTVFSAGCLADIQTFIEQLHRELGQKKRGKNE